MIHRRAFNLIMIIVLTSTVSACAMRPSANYSNATTSPGTQTDDSIAFRITDTAIVVATAKPKSLQTAPRPDSPVIANAGTQPAAEDPPPIKQRTLHTRKHSHKPTTSQTPSDSTHEGTQNSTQASSSSNSTKNSSSAKVSVSSPPSHINAAGIGAATEDEIDLGRSIISCSSDAPSGPNGCYQTVLAFAAPIDFEGARYDIAPNNHIWKTTYLAPTYVSRSERFKTLSINTEDHRKEIIETAGSIAVGLAKVAAGFGSPPGPGEAPPSLPPLQLPVVIDLQEAKDGQQHRLSTDPQVNSGWAYALVFHDSPDMSYIQRTTFEKGSNDRRVAFSSACRYATLTLSTEASGHASLSFGITVADPDYLVTTPLPAKGEVEFPELCGPASIKLEQTTQSTANELSDTFFKQVTDLRNALKGGASNASSGAPPKGSGSGE